MSINERLREAREASGLSQGQAAKKMTLHRPTVSEIEAGRRKVSAEEIGEFAKLYDVSVSWIINGSDTSNSSDTRILLAARELSKMNAEDLDRLMNMLRMLRDSENP
ncbi:helix-turn-helix domain-containing protein [Undibacterium sp. Ji42W]|uniref:helix-turn-helix domain-containing protein n=1 Tax=Undibacterium sp. Ji42W TaxID=3413039 RepID=UPI003BF3A422